MLSEKDLAFEDEFVKIYLTGAHLHWTGAFRSTSSGKSGREFASLLSFGKLTVSSLLLSLIARFQRIPVVLSSGWNRGRLPRYTRFEYGEFKLNPCAFAPGGTVTAAVAVANSGKRRGWEVVQLYAVDWRTRARRLAGFEKVELAPGENRTVAFTVDQVTFGRWEPQAHSFITAAGECELQGDEKTNLTVNFFTGKSEVDSRGSDS